MARAKNNCNGKLEEALLKLLQAQASLVEAHSSLAQTQASTMQTQAALTQTHNAFVGRMADMDARWAQSDRRRAEFERVVEQRFAELTARVEDVETILAEHGRILESLPDRIGAKFGFHMPEPKADKLFRFGPHAKISRTRSCPSTPVRRMSRPCTR